MVGTPVAEREEVHVEWLMCLAWSADAALQVTDVTNKLWRSVRGEVFSEAEERNKPSFAKMGGKKHFKGKIVLRIDSNTR